MSGGERAAQDVGGAELIAAVNAEAGRHAGVWFPGLDAAAVRSRIVSADARARCFFYRVELDDGRDQRHVAVKVRHSRPELRRRDTYADRPVLTPERTMSDRETAKLEYDGLRTITAALADADGRRFGVLRSLAWLPEHSAIVMDLKDEPTLRDTLLASSRFARGRRRTDLPDEAAWVNAGAWLRLFHDCDSDLAPTPRVHTRAQVADLLRAYAGFLAGRIGRVPPLSVVSSAADEICTAHLPVDLPLRKGHGDFVANNMFVTPDSRVTVFDPLPRWLVPPYQDLATLVVGMRVVPIQAVSQGLALPARMLARHESAVLRGYFGTDPVPFGAVWVFQLLVLLDRWSALVGKQMPHTGLRAGLQQWRVRAANRHYRREACRILGLLDEQRDDAGSAVG